MQLDRARTIRALVEAHTDQYYSLYINGPRQSFQRPEPTSIDPETRWWRYSHRKMVGVQYVVCCDAMTDQQKQEVVDLAAQWDDVAEAQITKRVPRYFNGRTLRSVGGNIRITFKTRAHSRTFAPGQKLLA